MRKAVWVSGLIAYGVAASVAAVLPAEGDHRGYLVDSEGRIVKSGVSGLCVRDSDWTLQRAIEPCDPVKTAAAPPEVPPPAPAVSAGPVMPGETSSAPAMRAAPKYSFSADALFAFDKSSLKPAGKAMLDDLVRQLEGVSYATIVATGHTDRFGRDGYNQRLSERRAAAVKAYLVGRSVSPTHVDAAGRGKAEPLTKLGECRGPRSPRIIACLQRDRRVDVVITGAKTVTGAR